MYTEEFMLILFLYRSN